MNCSSYRFDVLDTDMLANCVFHINYTAIVFGQRYVERTNVPSTVISNV